MLATFFGQSNAWFGYIANFFFAAAGFGSIGRWLYKLLIKDSNTRLEKLEEKLQQQKNDTDEKFELLLSQYRPNGGSSSKDQWNKIQSIVEDLKEGQEIIHERVDGIKQNFAEHIGYHKGLDSKN